MVKTVQKGRGRPVKSLIRDRMQQIVDALGKAYGYEVYKVYNQVFEPVCIRSMYYHLKRGCELGEFAEAGQKQEKGPYTWGRESTHIYYSLGEAASHKANNDLQEQVKKLGFSVREVKK
jgi:hypothetical protein